MRLRPTSLAHARHARRIRFLKMILPLIAVAILSSLFLFSRSFTISGAIPFADVDIEDRLREPKMTDVRIATMAENGAEVNLTAVQIVPQETGNATAQTATGKITAVSGAVTDISASAIAYDDAMAKAELTGGVQITSGGYVMDTSALDIDITSATATSRDDVRAVGPLGQLDAGRMQISQSEGKFLLVFNSGVRLIYNPK